MMPGEIKYVLLLIPLSLASFHVCAQKGIADTTVALKPVSITAGRLQEFSTGHRTISIDSMAVRSLSAATLADLISSLSTGYIKSYGPGELSTVALRGASSSHTAVLWNGFNLQSPMNGTMDFSLFPAGFSDRISLQYGGSGALFGSGAVGGTLHLDNEAAFGDGLRALLSAHAGSFGNYGGLASVSLGTLRTSVSIKTIYQRGENDFPYRIKDFSGYSTVRQPHAQVENLGVMAGGHWLAGKRQKISLHLWYQDTDREIPPFITQSASYAEQHDRSLRSAAEWEYTGDETSYFLRTALFSEMQHYTDSFPSVDANNNFLNSVSEFESRIRFGQQHLLNVGINNSFEQIKTTNYLNTASRNRTALFVNYRFRSRNSRYIVSVSAREEYSGDRFLSPVPSAGAEIRLWKKAVLRTSVSGTYRLPTFNDLFWNPGGNSELKPESGWSEELGLTQQFAKGVFSSEFGLTAFNSNISNWIIWLPATGPYWSPRNIYKVRSRGAELNAEAGLRLKRWAFTLSGEYAFTRSTNRKASLPGDASLNKQLIYIPQHTATGMISGGVKGFLLVYHHRFTGKRYVTSDNSAFLPFYNTGNIRFSKQFTFARLKLEVAIMAENLWNEEYKTIVNMAMPGRNFQGNIRIEFNKPIKSKDK